MTEHNVEIDTETEETSDIESMIDQCDHALDVATDRLDGRYRNHDSERIRCQYLSQISTLLRTKKQLIEAREMDRLNDDLAALEAELEREGRL